MHTPNPTHWNIQFPNLLRYDPLIEYQLLIRSQFNDAPEL